MRAAWLDSGLRFGREGGESDSPRAAGLDAARFVLIVLVVFGHSLEQFRTGPADAVYRFIYLFHMPAFIFLSGMVSRDTLDMASARRMLLGIVGIYLLHQALLQGLDATLFAHPFSFRPNVPYWALWYLMSLLWWRISLPFLLATGYPLAAACLLSLLAGIAPFAGYEWSLSRTLVFLPFFVAGHRWAAGRGLRLPSINPWAGIALLGMLAAAAWMTRGFSLRWYYGSVGYEALQLGPWQGMGYRALYLGLAGIGVAGVLVACSRLDGRIFGLGRYSIGAYILHLYLLKVAVALGLASLLWSQSDWIRLPVLLSIAVLVAGVGSLLARMVPWLFDLKPLVHKAGLMMARNPKKDLG